MAAGDEVMADEDKNPKRREQGPRRQRMGRWSADGCGWGGRAAGRTKFRGCCTKLGPEREAGHDAEVLMDWCTVDWCAGGVRRAVVWNRAAMRDALGRRGYSAWG